MATDPATEERLCPLEHQQPAKSGRGTVLCKGHDLRVLETLSQLATFDTEADESAHDQTVSRKAGQPLSGDRERPLPMSSQVAEHKVEIYQKLASWALLVSEELKVGLPEGPSTRAMGRGEYSEWDQNREQFAYAKYAKADPKALCAFLRRHHDWSVSQGWADDYAGEILALGRRAWALLHPSGRRQFTNKIMRCVELDEVDGSRCPGNMWCFLTPDDPYAEAKGALVCDQCGHEVTSDSWMSYGRKVIATENVA